ncbi:MAG TPA: type II toxin-antitoxin system RelE/ParE family toxin [Steroidobacteraceae bacterium]|nr:type II toxin-antitoxin system RelE/ParE family toxin [Steroidobacteraceae bacterium]
MHSKNRHKSAVDLQALLPCIPDSPSRFTSICDCQPQFTLRELWLTLAMLDVTKSTAFDRWFLNRKDVRARARIAVRLDRPSLGNPGDAKSVGGGVNEPRIDYGPGYRVYFMHRQATLIVLLCGGDKRTQATDIERAKAIAKEWRE